MSALCPCGSGHAYARCCQVFHDGDEPSDAEQLMRSRFSAFVLKRSGYLYRTLHPQHDDHGQGEAAFTRRLTKHLADRIVYQRLDVLDHQGADADGIHRVLFVAHVKRRGRDVSFAELSYFAHDGVGFRYLSGRTMSLAELGARRSIAMVEGG